MKPADVYSAAPRDSAEYSEAMQAMGVSPTKYAELQNALMTVRVISSQDSKSAAGEAHLAARSVDRKTHTAEVAGGDFEAALATFGKSISAYEAALRAELGTASV